MTFKYDKTIKLKLISERYEEDSPDLKRNQIYTISPGRTSYHIEEAITKDGWRKSFIEDKRQWIPAEITNWKNFVEEEE